MTIRTLKDAQTKALFQTLNRRQLIDDARGKQQLPRAHDGASCELHAETSPRAQRRRSDDLFKPQFDILVASQLLMGQRPELLRIDPVPSDEAMQASRRPIARRALIT